MKNDPIVKETRDARAKIFQDCDNNLQKLMKYLQESQNRKQGHIVTLADIRNRKRLDRPVK